MQQPSLSPPGRAWRGVPVQLSIRHAPSLHPPTPEPAALLSQRADWALATEAGRPGGWPLHPHHLGPSPVQARPGCGASASGSPTQPERREPPPTPEPLRGLNDPAEGGRGARPRGNPQNPRAGHRGAARPGWTTARERALDGQRAGQGTRGDPELQTHLNTNGPNQGPLRLFPAGASTRRSPPGAQT